SPGARDAQRPGEGGPRRAREEGENPMQRSSPSGSWGAVLGIAGLLNLANAAWMLADPEGWYHGLPAGVPHTGPLNEHFVRDIGAAFTVMGVALLWAAARPAA